MQAIVLAGGMGTRLKTRVADRPKPMAIIQGRPFLEYVLRHLELQGINQVVLAVGFMHELVSSHFGAKWRSLDIRYSIEDEPLGTGGAFLKAIEQTTEDPVFLLNGDSLFAVDLRRMKNFHNEHKPLLSGALKPILNPTRYGSVVLKDGQITGFREKGQVQGMGLINGGVYLAQRQLFDRFRDRQNGVAKFSFETDVLETLARSGSLGGFESDGFFIDIGIPEVFDRAQKEPFFEELFR